MSEERIYPPDEYRWQRVVSQPIQVPQHLIGPLSRELDRMEARMLKDMKTTLFGGPRGGSMADG